ncbi:hypothetical protein BN903_8 [Halorubrum sp. AJ67]|nr:hypothetical protein BN903_8 [Halorubrum sp. AJ67]
MDSFGYCGETVSEAPVAQLYVIAIYKRAIDTKTAEAPAA